MDEKDDRPIVPAWAVLCDGRLLHITLEQRNADEIAQPTSTFRNRRVVRGWFRVAKDQGE